MYIEPKSYTRMEVMRLTNGELPLFDYAKEQGYITKGYTLKKKGEESLLENKLNENKQYMLKTAKNIFLRSLATEIDLNYYMENMVRAKILWDIPSNYIKPGVKKRSRPSEIRLDTNILNAYACFATQTYKTAKDSGLITLKRKKRVVKLNQEDEMYKKIIELKNQFEKSRIN